jgi:hypothetical protein
MNLISNPVVLHSFVRHHAGRMMRKLNALTIAVVCGLMFCVVLPCDAQFNSGIRGVVTDSGSAAVPGANVSVTNLGTGITENVVTDNSGSFDFRSLAPAEYRLDVKMQGFSPASVHLTLLTDQTLNSPVEMMVGGVSSTVNVATEAPLLNAADSRLQTTLQQNQIDTLPLQGRTVIGINTLAPGVTGTGQATTSGVPDNFNSETYNTASANGRGFDGNLYIVDGLDITSSVRAGVVNMSPNPDSVQEIALQTNTYSVEYGRAGSIQTAITTKSGTNRFHGSASYYYTAKALWARNEFTPVKGYAPFHINNFSGTIGGAVWKDHTFLFASVEPLRSLTTSSSAVTYEAPEFVAWAQANKPNSLGTKLLTQYPVTKATFTGVSKTASQIFPVGSSAACGTATMENIPCTLPVIDSGNSALASPRDGTQWSVRGDQDWHKDRLYVSYYNTKLANGTPSVRQGMDFTNSQVSRSGQINETHIFSSNMINEAAFGALQIEGIAGLTGPFNIPNTTITGQSVNIGVSPAYQDFIQHNYHWRDTFSWVHGPHNVRAGFEGFHGDEQTIFGQQYAQPSFTFNNLLNLVQDAPYSETNIYYNPTTGQFTFFNLGVASTTFGFFAQDEWQPTPRLTITYGLRFDSFGNPHPSQALHSIISNFYLGSGSDFTTQVVNGGLRQSPNVFVSTPKAVSPRVGVSWALTGSGKWVVRGGFGIFHDWFTNGELTVPLRSNLPAYYLPTFYSNTGVAPIFAVGTSPTYPFNYPIPSLPPITLDSHGGVPSSPTTPAANIGGTDPNLKEPRIFNYTAGLERAVGKHLTVGANYAGSRAVYLAEGDVSTITLDNDINRKSGNLIASGGTVVRPNSSFNSIYYTKNGNESWYNAFIATFAGRFGSRDSFQMSYTHSRATDFGYQYPDVLAPLSTYNGPTNFNVPNRFSMSESISLPTLSGKNLALREVAGGWVVSGAVILQSGLPFTVNTTANYSAGGDYNADGYNYDIPNVSNYKQSHDRRSYLTGVFSVPNSATFSKPTPGTEGNELRNQFNGPGFANTDLSLLKRFPIRDWAHFEIRGDFFNLFNRVNLTMPSGTTPASPTISDLSSASFGKATSAFNARYVQLAARINF